MASAAAGSLREHPRQRGEQAARREANPLRRFAPALPKGEPRPWRERFLPLPLKDFPRSGEDVAQRQKGDKVSPKVTERAHPLPCGELPPQRLRGLQIGEARKMLLAKRLAFFRFDLCFGIIKGEQPLSRGSSASKSLALFWFSFGAKREQTPPGCSASKSPCPCRAEHAAFASQTGLQLKSPTGAFMPSGHRRPFWFSFVRQKRTIPARLQRIEIAVPLPR